LVLLAVVGVAVFANSPSLAACYPESADAAQSRAENATDWQGLYATFVRFGICDDGAVAEAFSDHTADILAQKWESISTLDRLAKLHPRFRQFVLRHIDSLMTPDQARTIEQNARQHCPTEAEALCREIAKHARDATRG